MKVTLKPGTELYRGITRKYRESATLSWWTPDIDHAVKYCGGVDGAQLLSIDSSALWIIPCPDSIGDSWLADPASAEWAMGLLRDLGAAGFVREDGAGIAVCLLPEACKPHLYEQF